MIKGINIWSGASGLGGALTNMSELARRKGKIKQSYPLSINGTFYADSEAAYQTLKRTGSEVQYNDDLMIDLISEKLIQNPSLPGFIKARGGVEWLRKCDHIVNAKSDRGASWEGEGENSRFIRNLIQGYEKFLTGQGKRTRVVHVREAPFDVYIGRQLPDHPQSIWHNPIKMEGAEGVLSRLEVITQFQAYLLSRPDLLKRIPELKGKTLGCWCVTRNSPNENCHGHVLAALAEGEEWEPILEPQGSLF